MAHPARRLAFFVSTLAATLLLCTLSGCSLWPKSPSLSSEPLPSAETPAAPAAAQAAAPASMPAPASAPSAQAATATPVAQPAPVKPVEAVEMAPMPAATPAPTALPSAPTPVPVVAVPAPEKVSPPAPLAHGFYVNVGVFTVPQNASTVRRKLEDVGMAVLADSVQAKGAAATRVRVGPFAKRAQAVAAAKKIHAIPLDAVVVRH